MRITIAELEELVRNVNTMIGIDRDAPHNTVGAVRLYRAYGGVGVHQVVTTGGGVTDLLAVGKARETYFFLRGMVTGLRTTRFGDRVNFTN